MSQQLISNRQHSLFVPTWLFNPSADFGFLLRGREPNYRTIVFIFALRLLRLISVNKASYNSLCSRLSRQLSLDHLWNNSPATWARSNWPLSCCDDPAKRLYFVCNVLFVFACFWFHNGKANKIKINKNMRTLTFLLCFKMWRGSRKIIWLCQNN